MPWSTPFPRSADRGIIEAGVDSDNQLRLGEFPRSADRGIIEARAVRSRGYPVPVRFRDQLIAASLKLRDRLPATRGARRFRDQLIAASLKRRVGVWG